MKSEVLLFPVLLLCTAFIQNVHGFLLEGPTNGGKHTTAKSQFLTNTEFLQAKQVLKQDTDDLRHDMDKTFALITSQLKSKFDLLETKLAEVDKRNETNNGCISMEKYLALEQKLINIQKENEVVKNVLLSLKRNTSKQKIKIEELQKLGTSKPLQEFSALQQSVHINTDQIQSLTMNEQARSQDFLALHNITTATEKRVNEIETTTNNIILQLKHNQTMKMKDMKQTLDTQLKHLLASYNATVNELETKEIYPLQQSVQFNKDKIQSLTLNEQARSQDILALHSIITSTGRKLTEMETSTKNLILHLENNQTMSMNNMKKTLDNQLISFQTKVTSLQTQLTSFRTSYNSTIYDLQTKEISMQRQITENNERVALFAWASDKSGNVIRFNNVQLSVGIKNISAFKSTGQFVCEKEGLYLIAASVASSESSSFCIFKGKSLISCTESLLYSGRAYHSGTSVATLHLHVNDNISIATGQTIDASNNTQFTLIKIK